MKKTYKDLTPQEETELVLWLGFFEHSVQNAYLQMKRWRRLRSFWDLDMFYVAAICVDDAAKGLKRFLSYNDDEVWAILKRFRDKVKEYNLKDLRNDIVHREKIVKLQDRKGNPLPESPILVLGGYNVDKDEYSFGTHRIKISETFNLVKEMTKDIRKLARSRLAEFYKTGDYEGMIPFTHLFSLASIGSSRRLSDTGQIKKIHVHPKD
jgi:hypothetical protein